MEYGLFIIFGAFFTGVAVTLLTGYLRSSFKASAEREQREAEVEEELERYRRSQIFAHTGTWDWTIKPDTLLWSDEIYPMFGYKIEEVSPSYELFIRALHPDDVERVQDAEEVCMSGEQAHDIEYRVVWPDGTVRWLHETGNVLMGKNGEPEKFTGIIRDITASKEKSDHYRRLAHYDTLTGLPNRELFHILLGESIERAKRHDMMVAVVFMDLNKFKPVNDIYGHQVGDKVLEAVGLRLTRAIRSIDTVARVGGDEFVAILEDIRTEEEVIAVVEKLRSQFGEPFRVENQKHDLGVSIGVSLYPDEATEVEELIHIADMAMYRAKESGENKYVMGQETPESCLNASPQQIRPDQVSGSR